MWIIWGRVNETDNTAKGIGTKGIGTKGARCVSQQLVVSTDTVLAIDRECGGVHVTQVTGSNPAMTWRPQQCRSLREISALKR